MQLVVALFRSVLTINVHINLLLKLHCCRLIFSVYDLRTCCSLNHVVTGTIRTAVFYQLSASSAFYQQDAVNDRKLPKKLPESLLSIIYFSCEMPKYP